MTSNTEAARVVVERYVADVLNGTHASGDELIADRSLALRVARFRSAFPDLEVRTHVLLEQGQLVAGHFTGRGTHQGVFQGVPPTGLEWSASCTAVYRVAGERIAEAWVNWDLLSLMEQLGALERARTVSA